MKNTPIIGASLIGKVRLNNEDSYLLTNDLDARNQLAIIADGIGGRSYGDIASRMTCELFFQQWEVAKANRIRKAQEMEIFLLKTLQYVNHEIYNFKYDHKSQRGGQMGSTIVAAAIMANEIVIIHLGDSRFYEITADNRIISHTRDHNLLTAKEDNEKLILPLLEERQLQHILTKAVGVKAELVYERPISKIIKKLPNSKYFLCSDGLTHQLSDEKILEVIQSTYSKEDALNKLILETYLSGAEDNLTIILI